MGVVWGGVIRYLIFDVGCWEGFRELIREEGEGGVKIGLNTTALYRRTKL